LWVGREGGYWDLGGRALGLVCMSEFLGLSCMGLFPYARLLHFVMHLRLQCSYK
jgi:hypothetical protein